MTAQRFLIVNADDFGQSPGVNRGVAAAHEEGIVTSASLMVRWPAAAEAAAFARAHPGLSVGLHLDLGEWVCRGGSWSLLYEVVPCEDAAAVRDEVARQLAEFQRHVGRWPTHLDSHQHVHRQEPARSELIAVAGRLGVPLRHFSDRVRYCGGFYGQTETGLPYPPGVGVPGLLDLVATLPPGVTELACHPGLGHDVETTYRDERAEEVRTLCDPRVRAALAAEGIALCTFGDLPAARAVG